jgi:hypothetical protein
MSVRAVRAIECAEKITRVAASVTRASWGTLSASALTLVSVAVSQGVQHQFNPVRQAELVVNPQQGLLDHILLD